MKDKRMDKRRDKNILLLKSRAGDVKERLFKTIEINQLTVIKSHTSLRFARPLNVMIFFMVEI